MASPYHRPPPPPTSSSTRFIPPCPSDHRSRDVARATAVAALVWHFRQDRASGWERERCAIAASDPRVCFASSVRARARLRAFGEHGRPTAHVDDSLGHPSLTSDGRHTPSFALSSVCLAYAPTVADFPWVSYLLISKGNTLSLSISRVTTAAISGGCISVTTAGSPDLYPDDGGESASSNGAVLVPSGRASLRRDV